jgi:hypothetical protein
MLLHVYHSNSNIPMQGVFADTFLKLFEDSDEPTLMAALQSFQQAGLYLMIS